MLALNNQQRYFLFQDVLDMCKGIDGLSGLVRDHLKLNPYFTHFQTPYIKVEQFKLRSSIIPFVGTPINVITPLLQKCVLRRYVETFSIKVCGILNKDIFNIVGVIIVFLRTHNKTNKTFLILFIFNIDDYPFYYLSISICLLVF